MSRRRLTVEEHAAWKATGQPPGEDDDLDFPLIENPPALRSKRSAARVLEILNQIATTNPNKEASTR